MYFKMALCHIILGGCLLLLVVFAPAVWFKFVMFCFICDNFTLLLHVG